jgi:NADH-quinone oxidoreductase subunit N
LSILASLTYFLLNAFITALFLFSLSCFLIIFQTTNFLNIAIILQFKLLNLNLPLLILGFICLLCVFLFKLSIVPFHWWIPAVFEGAPYISIMFLAIPVKLCVLFVLIKILYLIFHPLHFIWQPILISVSLFSMILGSGGLLFQTKLKKFWAYSTINHMGYLLLAISTYSWMGLRAVIIYFSAYILMNLGFFIICLSLTNDSIQQRIIMLTQFISFRNFKYTITAAFFSIILFSLIGIPPLLGFWGKYFVLVCVLTTLKNSYYIFLCIIIIIITSMIATAAYLKLWKIIFIEELYIKNEKLYSYMPIPYDNIKYLFLISFCLVILPLYFQGFFNYYIDLFISMILFQLF